MPRPSPGILSIAPGAKASLRAAPLRRSVSRGCRPVPGPALLHAWPAPVGSTIPNVAGRRARRTSSISSPGRSHAFHRLAGQRLGVGAPLYRHGFWTADVAEQNRRFHATRTVGLHPAELAEGVAIQLFAKVFHDVVAFGFAVHQHVQFQRFLLFDAAGDFCLHQRFIRASVELAAAVLAAGLANFRRLREGTDGGGRESRQLQQRRLFAGTLGVIALALTKSVFDGAKRSFDGRIVYARRSAAGGD